MKYKLLLIHDDGKLEIKPRELNSYEEVRDQAKICPAPYSHILHIGWIQWDIDAPYGGIQTHMFIKEALFNDPKDPNTHRSE